MGDDGLQDFYQGFYDSPLDLTIPLQQIQGKKEHVEQCHQQTLDQGKLYKINDPVSSTKIARLTSRSMLTNYKICTYNLIQTSMLFKEMSQLEKFEH